MENLKRYGPSVNDMGFGTMQQLDNGGWVKFSDIKELLQTAHNSAMDAIAVLKRIKFRLDAVRLSKAEHEIYDIVCSALQQHQ